MFERIAYVSRALASTGLREVYDIVRVANNRNAELGLTGALIFLDGYFLQVIEGLPHPLHDRFAIIAADTRHTEVSVRLSVNITTLAFPDYWMARATRFWRPPSGPLTTSQGSPRMRLTAKSWLLSRWRAARRIQAVSR
jgi:hypothetical protein